ncbi:hypothetical protein [Marinicellulosiphila megalodicopiae]|uniref:hypothetical protein n=1 Tax=Marinicellulosiphila megalodicopiae TaxID=2724896 RepID=UPI003BAE5E2C
MLLSAIDQYSNFQTSGQRVSDAESVQKTGIKEKETKLTDSVSISSQHLLLQSIANHFDVGNITFNQVNFLKSELFSQGLIPIKATDALTLATQSQPNHKSFSLSEITSQFYSTPGNLSFKPLLAPMQALFANLEAMHQSELTA